MPEWNFWISKNIYLNGRLKKLSMDELLRYLDSLYTFALRLTKDKAQAHDLTQQACLLAIKNAAQLRDKKSLKAWVFTILRNLVYESSRRTEQEPQMVSIDQLETEPLLSDWLLQPQDASHRALSQQVEQAVDSLPREMRMVLLLACRGIPLPRDR